jgi:hypothetical protein
MSLFLKRLLLGVVSMATMVCVVDARGQNSKLRLPLIDPVVLTTPQTSIENELHAMTQQAGVIFAGQVLAIHAQRALGSATGWVETEFRIEAAIRGCAGQGTYVLREWAGLWAGGLQRYKVGEQLLMLLHTPSASGLSSPVGGQDGAIPLIGTGAAPGPDNSSVVVNDQAVDVRWLKARLLRADSTGHRLNPRPVSPLIPVQVSRSPALVSHRAGTPGVRSNDRFLTMQVANNAAPMGSSLETGGTVPVAAEEPVQGLTLQSVLAMLGTWEAQQANAAR